MGIRGVEDGNGEGEEATVVPTVASAGFGGRSEGRVVGAELGEKKERLSSLFVGCKSGAKPYGSSSSSSGEGEKGSGGDDFPSGSGEESEGFHAAREAVMVLSHSRKDL